MKLLLYLPSTGRGGCEEYALLIAAAVRRAGYELAVSVPDVPAVASVRAELRQLGSRCYDWRCGSSNEADSWATPSQQYAEASALLADVRPDAVIMALPWPESGSGMIISCGVEGVPALVIFQLCNERAEMPGSCRDLCRNARQSNQEWIAVSENNRYHIARCFGLDIDEVQLVRNGTPLINDLLGSCDHVREQLRPLVRRTFGIERDDIQLALAVGRLTHQKGYTVLLHALARLPARLAEQMYLVIAGAGEDDELLRSLAVQLGIDSRVQLIGYRKDIKQLLVAADLFIFPSLWEGAAFALLEAMATGVGIIASDASSNPELIRPGIEGILVQTGNVAELADALQWSLAHPDALRTMGQAARRRVQAEFGAQQMVDATLALLQRVMSLPRNSGSIALHQLQVLD